MITIQFSYNWNNKLECKAFTTIRLFQPEKHVKGMAVVYTIKGVEKGFGRIEEVKVFYLANLNPYMSYLDTGYSVVECTKIIKTMYPRIEFAKQQLAFILIVKN
jgi:hypothetical protein